MTTPKEPQPYDEHINVLRQEIDRIDTAVIAYIRKRTEVSQEIGRLRTENGGEKIIPEREKKIHDRYSELGPAGHDLAEAVLELGRGPTVHES